jgi:hypothetical protein
VVDVLGLILAVAVTGANVQERDGGQLVLSGLKDRFARMARVWADGAYAGQLVEWAEKTAEFVLDIVRKPKGQIGFCVLPWRWMATRTDSRVLTVSFHDSTLVRLEHAAKRHFTHIGEEVCVR